MHARRRFVALAGVGAVVATAAGISLALAGPAASAKITSGSNLTSGATSQTVVIQVSNASGNPTWNAIRVFAPKDLVLQSGSTSGWTGAVKTTDNSVKFTPNPSSLPQPVAGTAQPSGLAPGSSVNLSVVVNAARVAQDTLQKFTVTTSSDGGSSYAQATSGASDLVTTLRVLSIGSGTINFASGRNGFVTAGQTNLSVSYPVTNNGSAALGVVSDVSGNGGDVQTAPVTTSVPAGGSGSLTVPITIGTTTGAGRSLSLGASTYDATTGTPNNTAVGLPASSPSYTVQAPVKVTYAPSVATLTPQYGKAGQARTISFGVTNAGGAGFTLSSTSKVTLNGPVTASYPVTTTNLASGNGTLTTGTVTLPSPAPTADGGYTLSAHLDGTDQNGAPVRVDVPVLTPLTLEDTNPVPVAAIATPHHAAVNGAARCDTTSCSGTQVVSNGDTITVSGTLTGETTPDVTVSCTLLYVKGGVIDSQSSFSCPAHSGTFAGSTAISAATGDDTIVLRTVATDGAGNRTQVDSNPGVAIDNTAPAFSNASKTTTPTTIQLVTSEPVTGTFSAGDFSVTDGNAPVQVSAATFDGTATKYGKTITLTLSKAIGEDDLPVINYRQVAQAATDAAATDEVALALAGSVTARDGVLPGAPTLTTVDGSGTQTSDSTNVTGFYTKLNSPAFSVSGPAAGQLATVYLDSDSSGGPTPGAAGQNTDKALCSTSAATSSTPGGAASPVSCTATSTLAQATYSVYVVTTDANGNQGAASAPVKLVVDQTPPTLRSATPGTQAQTVVVDFGEALAGGSNAADEWTVTDASGNHYAVLTVTSIVGHSSQRLLTLDDSYAGAALSVNYDPTGFTAYSDLAGNAAPASHT